MILELVLKIIINQSLSHELADDDLNLCPLLKKRVIVANFVFIVLNKFEKLELVIRLFSYGAVGVNQPTTFSLNFLLRQWLVRIQKLAKFRVSEFLEKPIRTETSKT